MKKKYLYLLAYIARQSRGRVEFYRDDKVKSFEDILAMEKCIEETHGHENVGITNYQLIGKVKWSPTNDR